MTAGQTLATGARRDENTVRDFRSRMRGDVLRPGDAGDDEARRVWNGMHDRRPAVIARCTGGADVIAAVDVALWDPTAHCHPSFS